MSAPPRVALALLLAGCFSEPPAVDEPEPESSSSTGMSQQQTQVLGHLGHRDVDDLAGHRHRGPRGKQHH